LNQQKAKAMFQQSAVRRPYLLTWAVAVITSLAMVHSASAANQTWQGDVSTVWQTAGNWVGNAVPGGGFSTTDVATFNDANTVSTAITMSGASTVVGSANFSGTDSYNFSDGTLYLTNASAFSNSSTGTITFNNTVRGRRDGNSTFLNTGGLVSTLLLMKEGATSTNNGSLIFDGGGSFQVTSLYKRNGAQQTDLVKNGGGTLTITSFQTVFSTTGTDGSGLTGISTINAGTIRVTSGDSRSLGFTPTDRSNWLTLNGGTLQVSTSSLSIGNSTLGVSLGAGNGSFNVDNGLTLTIGGAGGVNLVSGGGTLTKIGDGTLALLGANTYTGATNVNAGTFLVDGSTSASSAVTVGLSGALGGNGTIGGAVTVNGLLAPGNSPGILSFSNALTLNGTAILEIDGVTTRGTDFDGVNTGAGLLTYGGGLTFDIGTTLSGNHSFDLFQIGGGGQTGDFTSVNVTGNYTGTLFDVGSGVWQGTDGGGNTWSFSQASGDLQFVAVPEPAALALAASGLMGLAAYGYRRRKA
jgi:fibronectin-binding autotransporter adhesin